MATRTEGTEVMVPERQSVGFLAAILAAATDPKVDAAKVETLANLAVKLQDRERETEFNMAVNAAIMEMPTITKEGIIKIPANREKNTPERVQGRFARFEDIYRVVKPILERHQLAIRFDIGETQQAISVRPILSHSNGFTERGEAMRLPADTSGSKNAAQAVGSSSQYGKRYTMCAMLNIVTEGLDTDARGNDLPVSLPEERELMVEAEAKAAHAAGRYLEWFTTASPKDRAWLIQTGRHAQFGGQTQLQHKPATPDKEPPQGQPEPQQPASTGGTKPSREQRAKEWADWFKDELQLLRDAAGVDAFVAENSDTLQSLKQVSPALHAELDRAIDDKLATLA